MSKARKLFWAGIISIFIALISPLFIINYFLNCGNPQDCLARASISVFITVYGLPIAGIVGILGIILLIGAFVAKKNQVKQVSNVSQVEIDSGKSIS